MNSQLKVALIQANLVWENPLQNRLNFTSKIEALSFDVDVVVLPEMFTTGFTMQPELVAETMQGETVNWMKTLAKKQDVAITGSVVIKDENDRFRNRMLFVTPKGELTFYDKKHSFSLAGEAKKYTSGTEKVIVNYKDFNICLQICYDLRFPVFSRNIEDYDALIYVANWPNKRIEAWNALLKARAIENMCYVIGVNRLGLDANNFEYSGHSAIYDALGKNILKAEPFKEEILTIKIDKSTTDKARRKLGFLNDRDTFVLLD